MKLAAWIIGLTFLAGTTGAKPVTPRPPEAVVLAVQALRSEAWPQPGPGEDPADYPPPLPAMPDTRTVRGWLKDGVLRPVKVTPGPARDWLVDTERMDHAAYWCGTGGCEIQIWTSASGGRYRKVFDSQLREYHFHWIRGAGYTWMDADFHGSECGTFGVAACPWGFEWRSDGLAHYGFLSSWRFARGQVLHPGPGPQAIDPILDPAGAGVPDVIMAAVDKQRKACLGWQGRFADDGVVNRLPDVNGDGIDDWSYNGVASSCNFDAPDPAAGDASGTPAEPAHANDDPCRILDCENVVWLSQRYGLTVSWTRAGLEPGHVFALRYRKPRVELLQLNDPSDHPDTCDTYNIGNCDLQPISLSPKP